MFEVANQPVLNPDLLREPQPVKSAPKVSLGLICMKVRPVLHSLYRSASIIDLGLSWVNKFRRYNAFFTVILNHR